MQSPQRAHLSIGRWIKPQPDPLACYDCGLRYGGPGWMDAVVPHDLWERISPTGDEGGILCISCMAARCQALGLDDVPLEITSGPFCQRSLDGYAMQQNAAYRFALKKVVAMAEGVLRGEGSQEGRS